MRRDTQIGVILGVVILGIIAVFLSTRTDINKQSNKILTYDDSDKNEVTIKTKKAENNKLPIDIFKDDDDTLIENTLDEDSFFVSITEDQDTKNDIEDVKVSEDTTEDLSETEIQVEPSSDHNEQEIVAKVESNEDNFLQTIKADILVDEDEVVVKPGAQVPITSTTKKVLTHKVEQNDNLFTLAKRYYGDPKKWSKILDANTDVIYDRNSLPVGEELIIPEVPVYDANVLKQKEQNELVAALESNNVKPIINKSFGSTKHVVKAGDTLYGLAREYYGATSDWTLIYEANQDKIGEDKVVFVGNELIIPNSKKVVENKKSPSGSVILSSNTVTSSKVKSNKIHKIKSGETLFSIAKHYYNNGARWKKIYEANKSVIKNSNVIPVGKEIVIPE